MSYFLQPKRVKYRITLVIVGSLLEVTTSPTSPELTISTSLYKCLLPIHLSTFFILCFTLLSPLSSCQLHSKTNSDYIASLLQHQVTHLNDYYV
ncbi:hypothetical protein [Candidatus Tisiphia endosymbiont of Sialis lutaria]|uniref:hypothetical protein n=1 Tax=Candidatus Tisiphia endosymbiont of Sialis lutaria TaxID=2029164 RepID=UPI00312C7874